MKIVAKPDLTTWKYEFSCFQCDSKLEADHTDLQYRFHQVWCQDEWDAMRGGFYSNKDHYYVVCPVCYEERELSPNAAGVNIPYLLCEKVKSDYQQSREKRTK